MKVKKLATFDLVCDVLYYTGIFGNTCMNIDLQREEWMGCPAKQICCKNRRNIDLLSKIHLYNVLGLISLFNTLPHTAMDVVIQRTYCFLQILFF